jgi:hypothetical protein
MIKEAEENSLFDKSKKSMVNITYELDNLLAKAEILIEKELIKTDSISMDYFLELLKEVKEFYKKNNFTKISSDCLKNFKYIYNILVLEYIKSDVINFKSNSSSGSSKPKSDNVIDVELADET